MMNGYIGMLADSEKYNTCVVITLQNKSDNSADESAEDFKPWNFYQPKIIGKAGNDNQLKKIYIKSLKEQIDSESFKLCMSDFCKFVHDLGSDETQFDAEQWLFVFDIFCCECDEVLRGSNKYNLSKKYAEIISKTDYYRFMNKDTKFYLIHYINSSIEIVDASDNQQYLETRIKELTTDPPKLDDSDQDLLNADLSDEEFFNIRMQRICERREKEEELWERSCLINHNGYRYTDRDKDHYIIIEA